MSMCDVICTTAEWNDFTEILFCLKNYFQFNSNFKIDVLLFESFYAPPKLNNKRINKNTTYYQIHTEYVIVKKTQKPDNRIKATFSHLYLLKWYECRTWYNCMKKYCFKYKNL